MIKKLHALRAKKGFTLVELIVVIAIIGVLAAILVPTMLGMVTKSRVTSADSTAASLDKEIDSFLTTADTNGYGMLSSASKITTVNITVASGTWTISGLDATCFKSNGTFTWADSVSAAAGDSKSGVTNPAVLLLIHLADSFPNMTNASIVAVLKGGSNCNALAYTADTSSVLATTEYPTITNGSFPSTFAWDGHTAGISAGGYTVGTAPKVDLG